MRIETEPQLLLTVARASSALTSCRIIPASSDLAFGSTLNKTPHPPSPPSQCTPRRKISLQIMPTESPNTSPKYRNYNWNSPLHSEKPARHHRNQVVRITTTRNQTYGAFPTVPDLIPRGACIACVIFLQKLQNLGLTTRKHQTNPNQSTVYKIADQTPSEMTRS